MSDFYTVKKLANLLSVHQDTIYRMVKRNEIAHHRIGKEIRFSPEQISEIKKATLIPAREDGVGN